MCHILGVLCSTLFYRTAGIAATYDYAVAIISTNPYQVKIDFQKL